ncbi:MAG: HAD family hydrolase [Bacteroidota bacterium]
MMQDQWKLVIFDCDGVLVDSEPISCGVVAELSTELGHPMSALEGLQTFAGTSMNFVTQFIEAKIGKKIPYPFEEEYRRRTYQAFQKHLEPVEGVKSALEKIQLQKCVASNGPLEKVKSNLSITGLRPFFPDYLFSAYDIQRWKPDPALFLYAAKTVGISPQECIVVEDSIHGVEAAIAAGMDVLGFPGTTSAEILQKAGAKILPSMDLLPSILQKKRV